MPCHSLGGLEGSCDDREKTETDYFEYFTQAVKELLFNDEDYLHFKSELSGREHGQEGKILHDDIQMGSLYGNGIEAGLSDFKMEKLNSLVRESVQFFSSEVDEVLDSVEAMCKFRSRLGCKISWQAAATSDSQTGEVLRKELKVTSPSCSNSFSEQFGANVQIIKEISTDKCVDFIHSGADLNNHGQSNKKELLECRDGLEETKGDNLQLDLKTHEESEQSDSLRVKEIVNNHYDEHF